MGNAGTRVSTLEKCYFSITTSPQSATHFVHPKLVPGTSPGLSTVWPPLPLIIQDSFGVLNYWNDTSGLDNIIAALEHNDRVCQIKLKYLTSSELGYVTDSAAMHKPFPELTHFWLLVGMFVDDGSGPILPLFVLGGAAPRLRSLDLFNVLFSGLLKRLCLPLTSSIFTFGKFLVLGTFPPEVMATSHSALTSLESLCLQFRYPRPRPALESRRPPPPPLIRSILPSLTKFEFKGPSEYLDGTTSSVEDQR